MGEEFDHLSISDHLTCKTDHLSTAFSPHVPTASFFFSFINPYVNRTVTTFHLNNNVYQQGIGRPATPMNCNK